MHTVALSPVGVEVTGLQASEVDLVQARRLAMLLAEHGVAVLRDQDLDDERFIAFLRHFGELLFTVGETPVVGHPEINVVTNVGRAQPPRSVFHVDSSYLARPPAYTALRAVRVPARGGQTLFSNQYRAYETLSAELRARLAGRVVRHVVTGVDPGDAQEREAEHPLFRQHPLSGRTSIYLSTPRRCVGISGIDDREAAGLIADLYSHSTTEDNIHRHAWAPGDVVIWDNGCVMHRADHSGVVGHRVMHRGMSTGLTAAMTAA